jgi:hypothetical protein
MTEQDDVDSRLSVEDLEPTDDEILQAALSDDELGSLEIDMSDDLIAGEAGLVSDESDLSAEEAAIHVIET